MKTSMTSTIGFAGLPLCRSYVAVQFDLVSVRLSAEQGLCSEPLLWGLGGLCDGSPDFIGAWEVLGAPGSLWREVAQDLRVRGVERLRFALGRDTGDMRAALGDLAGCEVLGVEGATLDAAALEALLPGHRPYVERLLEVTAAVHRRLERALNRHGPFSGTAPASRLLHQAAARAIGAEWPAPPAMPIRIPQCSVAERPVAGR